MTDSPYESPSEKNGGDSPAATGVPVKAWGLGIVGAAMGALLGWFVFGMLISQGFYALALPGALVGLGFGTLSRRPMVAGGVFCAIVALVLMLMCEWHYRPWIKDESLGFFLTQLHDLSFMTFVFLLIGSVCAFWFGRGR